MAAEEGKHPDVADIVLALRIVDGPVLVIVFVLASTGLVFLCVRRARRWAVIAAGAAATGALCGAIALWLVEKVFNVFGTPLGWQTRAWILALSAALGLAGANFWNSGPWRKVAAAGASLIFVLAAGLGINAHYGFHPTVASLAGLSLVKPINLQPQPAAPAVPPPASTGPTGPPVHWTPPPGMPETGTTGTQIIPNPESGFPSRPAGIYLPPAALVPEPPALPLVVLMMGQPGNPDPQFIAAVLDKYASRHQGLAPIVIVADQLADPLIDSLCLDTPVYGNVETFINKDVLSWASTHLNVINDPRYRTIAGYSHGGQCAISFAAKYPQLWGNVLDISGEEYPGAEHPDSTLRDIFGGDQSAYDAQKPITILHGHHYPNTAAVFTVSNDDPIYVDAARKVNDAATSAGMTATYIEIPNAGHVIGALNGGLREGFRILYPRLGLTQAAPSTKK
ncbi:alpha/beta hydrolase [Arthrobacter liuii]|uniref:Esterase n=1 Tax=Arthrobacter liuii TaxID=1476996 RepID=A0ABQ2AVQ5_9MICC|nr:alpha/beta hydrolase-fold protein [Arthrobacter liuii]GGH99265.1 esterase [Arthrobacter liuii]